MSLEKEEEIIKSPYVELRNALLAQNDFAKKQDDIILFVGNYCRKEETNKFWYYCITVNIPLLPTFYKILADAFKLGNYLQVLEEVIKDRGTLSSDGDCIVDKHSGYIIRKIDLDISEGYEKSGFKRVSREIMEKDFSDSIMENIRAQKTSPDIKKIRNITMKICEEIGATLNHEEIIKNVTSAIESEIFLVNYKKSLKKKRKFRQIKHTISYTMKYCYIIHWVFY